MKNQKDCVFCDILNNRLESAPIWKRDFYTAILGLFPNVYGQTVLITNKHYPANFFDAMTPQEYQLFFASAREVIDLLKEKLHVKRVALIVEGMEIDHAHIKLYPLHGLNKEFERMVHPQTIYFENYEGYITTQNGPQADMSELKKIAEKTFGYRQEK